MELGRPSEFRGGGPRAAGLRAPRSPSPRPSGSPTVRASGSSRAFRRLLSWACPLLQGVTENLAAGLPRAAASRSGRGARRPAALMRFRSPPAFAESGVRSTRRLPIPATFRPQGFAPSRRFPPPETSRACFVPERSWGSRLQGLDPSEEPFPSRGRSSPAVGDRAARGCAELGSRGFIPPEGQPEKQRAR